MAKIFLKGEWQSIGGGEDLIYQEGDYFDDMLKRRGLKGETVVVPAGVSYFENMFRGMYLTDLPKIEIVPNLVYTLNLFRDATLDNVDFSEFDMKGIGTISSMFQGVKVIGELDLTSLNYTGTSGAVSVFQGADVAVLKLPDIGVVHKTSQLNANFFSGIKNTEGDGVVRIEVQNEEDYNWVTEQVKDEEAEIEVVIVN